MKTYGDIRLNSMLHLLSKILILLTLLTGSLQVFAAAPNSMVMGESDKAFGSGGHPYLLFSPERTKLLRQKLLNQEAGAIRFKTVVDKYMAGWTNLEMRWWQEAFMYPLSGEEKYCVSAVDRADKFVAIEEARIKTFANGGAFAVESASDSFLHVGSTVGAIGAAYDWCYGFLTEEQKSRWIAYGNEVLHNLWYYKDASWGGRVKPGNGYATNNPLNNYYYSFLEATMYFGLATQGDNPKANDWLVLFRQSKVENQLLPVFAEIKGGGSAEGTGYGTSLRRGIQLFDWWRDSTWKKEGGTTVTGEKLYDSVTGEKLYDSNSLARDSLDYMVHSIVPSLTRIAPYGDHARDSGAWLYDSHRAYLLFFSSLYPESDSAKYAKSVLEDAGLSQMKKSYTADIDFIYSNNPISKSNLANNSTYYYAESVGHIFSRSDWTKEASYFSASIGPYFEVHDHRDKNSFLFYKNEWLAYDHNVNTHSGTNFREDMHNMVRFDNLDSDPTYLGMIWGAPSPVVHAVEDNSEYTYVSADTAPLYEDRKTKVNLVEKYKRDMVYIKPDVLIVYDQLTTAEGTNIKKTWQLQSPIIPQYSGGANTAFFQGNTSSMKVTTLLPIAPSYFTHAYPESESGYRLELSLLGESVEFLNVLDFDETLQDVTILSQDSVSIVLRLAYNTGATKKVTIFRCCGEVKIE